MYNGKVELTREEYYMLLGLKKMSENYEQLLKGIQDAVVQILQEVDMDGKPIRDSGDGWSGELVYTQLSVDEFINKLNLEVL